MASATDSKALSLLGEQMKTLAAANDDMKAKVITLEKKMIELEYRASDNYCPPAIAGIKCNHESPTNPVKVITKQTMVGSKCRIIDQAVGWKCVACGYHVMCRHLCEMYQCGNSIECGFKKCMDCFVKSKKYEENKAKNIKCIRCVRSHDPEIANPFIGDGKFCSAHCAKMCDLYDY